MHTSVHWGCRGGIPIPDSLEVMIADEIRFMRCLVSMLYNMIYCTQKHVEGTLGIVFRYQRLIEIEIQFGLCVSNPNVYQDVVLDRALA